MRIVLIAAVFAASSVSAQTLCDRVGSTSYCNRADSSTLTVQRIGSTAVLTDSTHGRSGVASQIGDSTYTSRSDGTLSTTSRIGDTAYTTDSRGVTTICRTVGNSRICY